MKLAIAKSLAEALTFSLRHAVPFYLLALVAGLPTYLHSFLPQETLALQLPEGEFETILPRPWWETTLVVPAIESVLLGTMVAIMVHTLQRDRRGESGALLSSLTKAAPHLPTVVAVSLIITLVTAMIVAGGEFLGHFLGVLGVVLMLLLMVLLVVLQLVFCVTVPSAAVDNAGIIGSFERSAALTAGLRGQLLGLIVVIFLPFIIVVGAGVMLFRDEVFSTSYPNVWVWLFGAALAVYYSALIVVIHEALVTLKEGPGQRESAAVFD